MKPKPDLTESPVSVTAPLEAESAPLMSLPARYPLKRVKRKGLSWTRRLLHLMTLLANSFVIAVLVFAVAQDVAMLRPPNPAQEALQHQQPTGCLRLATGSQVWPTYILTPRSSLHAVCVDTSSVSPFASVEKPLAESKKHALAGHKLQRKFGDWAKNALAALAQGSFHEYFPYMSGAHPLELAL